MNELASSSIRHRPFMSLLRPSKRTARNARLSLKAARSSPSSDLLGARGQFPIAWEMIYEAAMRHHAANLRLEAEAEKSHKAQSRKPAD